MSREAGDTVGLLHKREALVPKGELFELCLRHDRVNITTMCLSAKTPVRSGWPKSMASTSIRPSVRFEHNGQMCYTWLSVKRTPAPDVETS